MIQLPEDQKDSPYKNPIPPKKMRTFLTVLTKILGLSCIAVVIYVLWISREQQTIKKPTQALPPAAEDPQMSCTSSRCIQNAMNLVDSMNSSVDPCEDFFQFACGGWIAKNPIPFNLSKWSQLNKLHTESSRVTRDILSHPVQPSDSFALKQAKEFYSACVDVDALDRVGLNPILSFLDKYGGWPMLKQRESWSPESFDWIKSVADLKRLFRTSAFFDIQISQNPNFPQYNTIHLSKPSIPSRLDHQRYSRHFETYKEFIMDMANELAKAEGIVLDQNELIRSPLRIRNRLRNPTTLTVMSLRDIFGNHTLSNASKQLDMKQLLEYTFLSTQVKINETQLVSIEDPRFTRNVYELITNTNPQTISNYIGLRMLEAFASESTKRMREILNKYQQQFGSEESSRESACALSAVQNFGFALSRPYLERRESTHKEISQVLQMVQGIRQSFVSLLDGVKWTDPTVETRLRETLASIKACVGFPPWMLPSKSTLYEETLSQHHFNGVEELIALDLREGSSYLDKLRILQRWKNDEELNELQKRFTSGCDWTAYIGLVNSFYESKRQTINFPLGILQPPFFYAHDSFSALNFGSIGSLIGRQFAGGLTGNGWAKKDDAESVAQCLVDQYSGYRVKEVPGGTVNGALTLEEHFADNVGLTAAYRAYQRSPHEHKVIPRLEQFTQDQLFFLGYANSWCSSSRSGDMGLGSHTPHSLRLLQPLHNMREFAAAWNCPPGSNLNPLRITRCKIF